MGKKIVPLGHGVILKADAKKTKSVIVSPNPEEQIKKGPLKIVSLGDKAKEKGLKVGDIVTLRPGTPNTVLGFFDKESLTKIAGEEMDEELVYVEEVYIGFVLREDN